VVVVVPRLVERSVVAAGWPVSATFWADTQLRLPPRVREWTNLLSSQRVSFARPAHVPLAELTASWPWLVLYGRE
jgi:hypothetical protein